MPVTVIARSPAAVASPMPGAVGSSATTSCSTTASSAAGPPAPASLPASSGVVSGADDCADALGDGSAATSRSSAFSSPPPTAAATVPTATTPRTPVRNLCRANQLRPAFDMRFWRRISFALSGANGSPYGLRWSSEPAAAGA
jgi:hypothetical protein